MGVYHQYHSKKYPNSSSTRPVHCTIPTPSNFLYDKSDFIWNNPTELNLLHMTKAPIMPIMTENYFLKVLPCIRRLYTAFNSICPNLYRIHCSDSFRIFQELISLIEEYLHIHPPLTIPLNQLLYNEEFFDDLIHQLRLLPFYQTYSKIYSALSKPEIRCFGQGIHACDYNNQLHENLVFCFELTTSLENQFLSPIDVIILDPNENLVLTDIKYINTYDRSSTKLFSCSYKPITQPGTYKISFIYNHNPLTIHPFTVFIRNSKQEKDLNTKLNEQEIPQYELEGDGYSKKVIVNSIARFRLRITSSIPSYLKSLMDLFSLSILDPHGHSIVVQRRLLSSDLLELTYQPMSIGEHQLSISFNKKFHRQLMINVIHDESNSLSKFKPFGPGLQRAIVGLPTEFYVDLNHQTTANHHPIQFSLEPSYHAVIDYEQQMATVRYTPFKQGHCPIHILEYNKDILHSPFIAHIQQEDILYEKPHLQVTGLTEQMIIHRPVEFQVMIANPFNDPAHLLHIEILTDENPPSISIRRHDQSLYICSFIPITLGRHLISIDYAGIVAENNPFTCQVIQEKDIQLTGPAMNHQCLILNQPTHFYFKLKDFLTNNSSETNLTYESGYSSNEDTSLNSSSEVDRIMEMKNEEEKDDNHYRVTITDGHGHLKSNISIKDIHENRNDNIRVDFTPDEQILFINISCTCMTTFAPQSTSTPKKLTTTFNNPNLCSTPRPGHVRYSLSKYLPLPVDSSTPNIKKMKKSFAPDIHQLIYSSNIPTTTTTYPIKIWLL